MLTFPVDFQQKLLFGAGRENRQPFARLELRSKLFVRPVFGEQIVDRNAENFRHEQEFTIGHAPQLSFQFSQ